MANMRPKTVDGSKLRGKSININLKQMLRGPSDRRKK